MRADVKFVAQASGRILRPSIYLFSLLHVCQSNASLCFLHLDSGNPESWIISVHTVLTRLGISLIPNKISSFWCHVSPGHCFTKEWNSDVKGKHFHFLVSTLCLQKPFIFWFSDSWIQGLRIPNFLSLSKANATFPGTGESSLKGSVPGIPCANSRETTMLVC